MFKQISSVIIVIAAAIALVVVVRKEWMREPLEYAMSDAYGGQMVAFALPDGNGEERTVDAGNGKPKLINFWTSWCGYCKREAPHLNAIYAKYKDSLDIVAVNVATSDSREEADRFLTEYNLTVPALFDEDGTVSAQYRVTSIPTNYFVRSDGTIEAITYEITEDNAEEVIRKLLGGER